MNNLIRCAIQAYAIVLRLYPRAFRDEFGQEMQSVMAEALDEAAATSLSSFVSVCWRELRQAPLNIWAEHWRERKRQKMEPRLVPTFEKTSWRGILAALMPFLFMGFIKLGPFMPAEVVYLLLGLLLVLLLAGLARGLTRWSLPIAGFLASILTLVISLLWHPLESVPILRSWSGLLYVIGLPWPGLIVLTLIILVVSALVGPLRPFYERVRTDWTLLAFALYGSAALWLFFTYDEYVGEEPYCLAEITVLVGGAITYLLAARPGLRFWALFGSLSLFLFIVVLSKWVLVPIQTWPIDITDATTWREILSTLIQGTSMMVSVLGLPALLNLIPRAHRPAQPT